MYVHMYDTCTSIRICICIMCSVIDDMILTNQGWANDDELLLLVTILDSGSIRKQFAH